ncbi:MAG TPA: phosphoglucosamine mutase [Planctomycetota bacterium]|nr:phosphoglucosamine mutase [Planctomycetota bacterium]
MQGSDLMISVSGIRGIVGRSLTPELLVRMGHAFGTYCRGGRIVVGRDTRVSGEMAKHAVLSGLIATGVKVLDLGVCATPTLTTSIEHLQADGGVMVTASHNPIEWNALKFFRRDGLYLNAEESRDLLNIYYSGQFNNVGWDQLAPVHRIEHADARHVEQVLKIVNRELFSQRRLRVALDCCNGAGCNIAQRLLSELNCEVETIHCNPNGLFPHKPEPVCANLGELCAFVKKVGADVGFAVDPDADRVTVIDETGYYVGEEAALALSTQHALATRASRGPVVINMSTSRMTEDVARAAGCEVVRVAAGESNVAEKMKELNASFGGEGNGGIIDPAVHVGRDAIIGMALMLESMLQTGQRMSQLAQKLPAYQMVKAKVECPPAAGRALIRKVKSMLRDVRIDTRDGMRVDWDDRWVQLRASNTEPILRIIAEARTAAQAQALVDEFTAMLTDAGSESTMEKRPRANVSAA